MENKKTKKANLEIKKDFFFQTGLVIALMIVLAAFEWKTYTAENFRLPDPTIFDTIEIIDSTDPEEIKPEPPKPQLNEFIEIDDTLQQSEIDIEIEIDDFKPTDYVYTKPDLPDDIDHGNSDEPFVLVENMPEFPGGEGALFEFLGKNLKYPRFAVENEIQGTVHVTFVVERDGNITGVQILRGIGGGCDEEAVRVIRNMPKWSPGKQRGIPVRVQFNLPVKFSLRTQ